MIIPTVEVMKASIEAIEHIAQDMKTALRSLKNVKALTQSGDHEVIRGMLDKTISDIEDKFKKEGIT